mgnify:FL=1
MAQEAYHRDRLAGCLWGPFVGDAFCLGSHWIYDAAAFAARFPDGPAGFDTPGPDHHHAGKLTGDLTHYGDGALALLRTLATDGADPAAYGRRLYEMHRGPAPGRYVDKPTRHLLGTRAERTAGAPFDHGADDDQNVTPSRLAPLVVFRLGHPALMTDVDAFTRVLQANDRAVAYACTHARLLERLLAGDALDDAVARVAAMLDRRTPLGSELGAHLDAAGAATDRDVASFTADQGRACRLVQAFPAALHAALVHQDRPAEAVRATCRARGDNAGRAMLIGSWLGALHGVAAFPAEWRRRLRAHDEIAGLVDALLARRDRAATAHGRRPH